MTKHYHNYAKEEQINKRVGESSSWGLPSHRPVVMGALVAMAGVLTGLALLMTPLFLWALISIALALALAITPACVRVGAAVLAATFSRLLTSTGIFPELLNFFHYPLTLAAAFFAAIETAHDSPVRRALERGLLALLAVSLLSWLINGGEFLRPVLDWLVFAEPLLIIYAVTAMPPDPRTVKALWKLALVIPFVQLPLAAYQALTLGLGDRVQGLFINMGAGAHVAGAVAILGAMICVARGISAPSWRARPIWLLSAAVLVLVAVLADANQVIVCFLPALLLLLFSLLRLHWTRVIVVFPILVVLILGVFSFYRPLQRVLDLSLISRGIYGKLQALSVISAKLSSSVGSWIIGLGPGNSVSRVAMMGLEAFVRPSSPVALLGLRAAPTTGDIWILTASDWLYSASSVWSGYSSWLGLLGDLGLAGLGLYFWMSWRIWHGLTSREGWQTRVAKSILLMCGLLGVVFGWLEEPGFTLLAALVVGLGLIGNDAPKGWPAKKG